MGVVVGVVGVQMAIAVSVDKLWDEEAGCHYCRIRANDKMFRRRRKNSIISPKIYSGGVRTLSQQRQPRMIQYNGRITFQEAQSGGGNEGKSDPSRQEIQKAN